MNSSGLPTEVQLKEIYILSDNVSHSYLFTASSVTCLNMYFNLVTRLCFYTRVLELHRLLLHSQIILESI